MSVTSSPLTSLSSLDETDDDPQFQSSSLKEPLISFDELRTAQVSCFVDGQRIVNLCSFKALVRPPQLVFTET